MDSKKAQMSLKGGYTMNPFNYSKAKFNEIFSDVKRHFATCGVELL